MDRSKLEYMVKNLSMKQKGDIYVQIDPDGEYEFDFLTQEFLKNPDTKDPFVIIAVPNYMDPEAVEAYKLKYIQQFEKINDMCKENKIYPFFQDPTNLVESEATRKDICKKVHESILNKYFKCNSFYDYNPPVYDPKKENQEEVNCGKEMGE